VGDVSVYRMRESTVAVLMSEMLERLLSYLELLMQYSSTRWWAVVQRSDFLPTRSSGQRGAAGRVQ